MYILFLGDAKNDTVKYSSGDIKETQASGYGNACNWVLDNTDKGYVQTLPIDKYMKFVIVPTHKDAIKIKSYLLPNLLTKEESEFLNEEDFNSEV